MKLVIDPNFALEITKKLTLSECDDFFSKITTLLFHEDDSLEKVMTRVPWKVYHVYENYRTLIREQIESDLSKLSTIDIDGNDYNEIIELYTRFYELAEMPYYFNKYFSNTAPIQPYLKIEQFEFFELSKDTIENIEIALLKHNTLEVRTKNPLFFLGFFTESKFFLKK